MGRFKIYSSKEISNVDALFPREALPGSDNMIDDTTTSGSKPTVTSSLLMNWSTWVEDLQFNTWHYIIRYAMIAVSIYFFIFFMIDMEDGFMSYVFMAGCGTAGLMFIGLEKTLFPIRWILSWYLWFPFASLSYNGYLYSMLTGYMFTDFLINVNHDRQILPWTGNLWDWLMTFFCCFTLSLLFAVAVGFLIERPFMHLSKKLTFDWIRI